MAREGEKRGGEERRDRVRLMCESFRDESGLKASPVRLYRAQERGEG
jgi:hypothetical protein